MKRVLAWLLHGAYRLENHHLFEISLRNWLWAVVMAPPLVAFLGRLSWPWATFLSLMGFFAWVGAVLARERGYAVFEPAPVPEPNEQPPLLNVDEQIPVRVSGLFAVGGNERLLLNERAQYSFMPTREHVVMAYVDRTRFLLLARSRQIEAGWWYVFWKAARIRRVETGYVCAGLGRRPGIALTYQPEERPKQEAVYLTFDDHAALARVIADLRSDAPPQVFAE